MNKFNLKKIALSSFVTTALLAGGTVIANADTVTVKSGDSLSALAATNGTTVNKIAQDNHIANPQLIFVGQSLQINGGSNASVGSQSQAAQPSNVSTRSTTTSSSTGQNIVNYAARFLGTPYVWGGGTPAGFDCSGLVQYVFANAAGINLAHYTGSQAAATTRIPVSQAKAGDLYFWANGSGVYHVAIATGNGQYIEAPKPGDVVKTSSVNYWAPSFATRVAGVN
ncbi:C40 family peptidase [Periweissella cryptocerci]|nr:NlpC/P60 family protein [Periweissella cryptocerci]